MAIIDRYLLKNFLGVFMVFFLSFFGLFVVGDTVNNFGELHRYAESNGGLFRTVLGYYGLRSLVFFDWMNPLLILVAAMFTIATFRRHNEMTALMAAGIRNLRMIRPLLIMASVLVLLAVINREFILPSLRQELSLDMKQQRDQKSDALTPVYDNQTDILLSGKGLILSNEKIVQPNFFLPRNLDRYGVQLLADEALYQRAAEGRPRGYLLSGVRQPEGLVTEASLQVEGVPTLLTPRDTAWLEKDECFVVSGVEPKLLASGGTWQQFSSTSELADALENPSVKHNPSVEVELHSRFVQPFLDINLLLLGLPLVLTRQSRSLFFSVGLCVLLIVVFMAVIMLCHSLGSAAMLSPSLAVWLPLMFFVPLAVATSLPLSE
ncbi:MAG: LptF/LptG family permease [Pirellulales bacterium]|nr:LptF/LptG family permease [Pirellulales bacterium]